MYNWLVKKFNKLIGHLAGWNRFLIFILFSMLINFFSLRSVLVLVVNEYSSNPDYYSSFLIGFLLQQCFFILVMVFILIEISKIKIKPFSKAFAFVVILVLIKVLLAIYTCLSLGLSIGVIEVIRQVTSSVRLWLYCYVLAWLCFTVVNISSKIKKE